MILFNLIFYKSNLSLIINIGIFFLFGWLTNRSSSAKLTDYPVKRSGIKQGNFAINNCYKCVYDEAKPIGDADRNNGCIKPVGVPGPGDRNCSDVFLGYLECVKKTTVVTKPDGTQVKKLERIPCHDSYYGAGDLHVSSDDSNEKKCQTNTTIGTDGSITVLTACVCNTADYCNSEDGIDTIDPNATSPTPTPPSNSNNALVCYECVYDDSLPIGDANRNDGCLKPVGNPGIGSINCKNVMTPVWECVKKTTVVTYPDGSQVKKLERIPCYNLDYGPGTLHLESNNIKEKKCQTDTEKGTLITKYTIVISVCVCNTADFCNSEEGIDTIDPNANKDGGTVSRTTTDFIIYSLIITKLSYN